MQQVLCDYPSIIHNMKVEGYTLHKLHDMGLHAAYNFVSYLSEIKKQDKTTVKLYSYPATPWDFLKEKYAPKWFLGRWPVKYSTRDVEVLSEKHFMCPHLVLSDNYPHVMWMHTGGEFQPESTD